MNDIFLPFFKGGRDNLYLYHVESYFLTLYNCQGLRIPNIMTLLFPANQLSFMLKGCHIAQGRHKHLQSVAFFFKPGVPR